MNFLELCAEVARESGAVGSAPAAVTAQTGRQAKVVAWVRQAWEDIQTDNPYWTFLRKEFSGTLSANVMEYAASALGITDFAEWNVDTEDYQPVTLYTSGAQANEVALRFIAYQSWRTVYNRGSHDAMQPVHYSISPSKTFLVGPKPNAGYIVRGEYQRSPQVLAANNDEPILPTRFHGAIVWRACMMLAEHDEAPTAFAVAARKYGAFLLNMERDLLPAVELGGNALA